MAGSIHRARKHSDSAEKTWHHRRGARGKGGAALASQNRQSAFQRGLASQLPPALRLVSVDPSRSEGYSAMITDSFAALVKDLCLIACGMIVWHLAPTAMAR